MQSQRAKAPTELSWAYGVTTVPERFGRLLPQTLDSLEAAGFPEPRLFIDGAFSCPDKFARYNSTCRGEPALRTFGNWVMSAWELIIRHPNADRYAIFQDDFVTYKNLRQYLEQTEYPDKSYLNLYTFPSEEKPQAGFHVSRQRGKGAVALVFNNDALRTLLAQPHITFRSLSAKRGWRAVDGGIVEAMRKIGYREYVHNPSLVQHIGTHSSMGNARHLQSQKFRGEKFDALDLLQGSEK